jgi:class 3 adenylate cyclase
MVNSSKYKNYTNNLLKISALFLALGTGLYAFSETNVTSGNTNLPPKLNIISDNPEDNSIINDKYKTLFITTESGILTYNQVSWKLVPISEKYIVNVDQTSNLLIAGESFLGKLILPIRRNRPNIDTLVNGKLFKGWEKPEKLFCLGKDNYLCTQNFLYKLEGRKLVLVDSSHNGMMVLPGKTEIMIIKKNNRVIRIKGKQRDTMAEFPFFSENDKMVHFYEIIGKVPSQTPFYFRWWAWTSYSGIFVVIVSLYWWRRRKDFESEKAKLEQIIKERTAELMREKEKTDELLANLLPKDTADELKNTGKATSQKFNMVTVLFSDIQGFTKIAEQMNPEKLIDELDNFFFHFDSVVEKYNIEKIKTIGDAYMCAGGIPYKNRTNPVEVVLAAVEIQNYMRQLKQNNNNIWDLRIGIHTGAVIAGVVGHKRMSYDIWGDTVNTASRMESSGQPGKVNVSGHTYELVKDFFICEYRGRMPVKYKGDIDMYFVKGIRPELSVDLKVVPNKKFFIQLQLLRLLDLEEFIIDKLENELQPDIYFHNAKHTKDVYTLTELIGRAEDIAQEDLLLCRTAALFIDTGYITNYDDHESENIRMAREILPKFRYSKEQIDVVCNLLLSLKFTDNNKSKPEAILLDACQNYFGRVDFIEHSKMHFQEIKKRVVSLSEKEWFYHELHFIERFKFFTETAKMLQEVTFDEQILKIKDFAKLN